MPTSRRLPRCAAPPGRRRRRVLSVPSSPRTAARPTVAGPGREPLSGAGWGALLGGQAGLDPVLDAVGVLADVGVAELLESGGDLAAVGASLVRAVGDDRGVLVRQQVGGAGLDVVGDEVERAGQVLLGVVRRGERVDEDEVAGVQSGPELVAVDRRVMVVSFGGAAAGLAADILSD
jgi:hypothetical protein